jgi:hypothetical protein
MIRRPGNRQVPSANPAGTATSVAAVMAARLTVSEIQSAL